MADTAIEKARAQRDAADRTLAEHNLALVTQARAVIANLAEPRAQLKAIADQMDPGSGKDNLGHLIRMLGSVDTGLEAEGQLHQRTLTRLDQA